MKYLKKVLFILICIGISFLFSSNTAAADTTDSIREKEAEIEAARKEITKLKSGLSDVEEIKKQLEQSKNDLATYVTQLDTELNNIQARVVEYNELIDKKELEIEVTTEELNDAITRQEEQYDAMKQRIKFMYERGDTFYMEIIFSSGSYTDMMNKADYIEALSSYDRKQLDEYVKTAELIAVCKEELE